MDVQEFEDSRADLESLEGSHRLGRRSFLIGALATGAAVAAPVNYAALARKRRIPTSELNRFVAAVTAVHPPASPGRREVRILYAAQTAVAPPTFVFFTNVATEFHFSYERFLVNRLRESFGLIGTPIRIHVRRREKKEP